METGQHAESGRKRPEGGQCRRAARLFVGMYGVGLGPLFRGHLLLLHHVGRVSGRDHRVVLAVLGCDAERGTWTVACGAGPGADWYQNLRAEPKTTIQVGNRHYAVTAAFLSADEGGDAMADYASARPAAARRLCELMGLDVDHGAASYERAGRRIPFVRFEAAPEW